MEDLGAVDARLLRRIKPEFLSKDALPRLVGACLLCSGTVVVGAALGIAQHAEGGHDLVERVIGAARVGMSLLGALAERDVELLGAGLAADTESGVQIGHLLMRHAI